VYINTLTKNIVPHLHQTKITQMHRSFVITFSGLFGGMTKAISSGFIFCSISLPHIVEIAVYAAISALVGYMVKLGIDSIRQKYSHYKKQNKR
jgi:uncharacterized membrane protein YjfL (UPF0719 family)